MSQVFAADSVSNQSSQTVITTNPINIIAGNFINPPFGNAKAIVIATIQLLAGTNATSLNMILRRNPNTENFAVSVTLQPTVTGGGTSLFTITGADQIPDGRAVQYALQIQQNAATGNGTVVYANITALLISG
jgi:hypothetical protein